MSGDCLPPAER